MRLIISTILTLLAITPTFADTWDACKIAIESDPTFQAGHYSDDINPVVLSMNGVYSTISELEDPNTEDDFVLNMYVSLLKQQRINVMHFWEEIDEVKRAAANGRVTEDMQIDLWYDLLRLPNEDDIMLNEIGVMKHLGADSEEKIRLIVIINSCIRQVVVELWITSSELM